MKYIVIICRILTGAVFTFSGFVKAIDPIGTSIKLNDYFEAMGLQFLSPFALVFAFLLNAAELGTGLLLLSNVMVSFASWVALFFMLLFTPLTLWLAISNAVTDCGCFGDFIVMDNWQTFYKNAVIIVFVLFVFFFRNKFHYNFSKKFSFTIFGIIAILCFWFQIYNYRNEPIIDFRPFKVGASIIEGTTLPEGAKRDVYKSYLMYKNKKTGKVQQFDDTNYPWQDSLTWEFVATENILVEKGEEPKIHDFYISNSNGEDITKFILKDENFSFLFASYSLEEADKEVFQNIEKLVKFAEVNNLKFYVLTSSSDEEIKKLSETLPVILNFCKADGKMLKTMIRSNPGLIMLKSGVVHGKWAAKNIPTTEEFQNYFIENQKLQNTKP